MYQTLAKAEAGAIRKTEVLYAGQILQQSEKENLGKQLVVYNANQFGR
jgi:hypothetical protein